MRNLQSYFDVIFKNSPRPLKKTPQPHVVLFKPNCAAFMTNEYKVTDLVRKAKLLIML